MKKNKIKEKDSISKKKRKISIVFGKFCSKHFGENQIEIDRELDSILVKRY